MKRLFIFSLLLLSSAAYAKNKISMVTYFPVPYVAYSQVNTTDQMDIGLTSACSMKLGCSETSSTLNATRVNLKGGKLNLDGGRGIKGYSLNLGSGYSDGRISFQNVRIQTGNMESVNAADIKATNLNLFGKAFPSCKAANSESGGQMQWASLKLKGASSNELYLMCGDFGTSTCAPTHNGQEVYTGECPSGQTGTVTYTWDYTACKYNESSTCEGCTWKYEKWTDYPYDAVRNGTPQNAIYCPDGSDVEKYKQWRKSGMTRTEYVRWVCSPVVPNLGGAQVWIAQYDSTNPYRICTQVDNPPVPTSEKDLCIMESSFCNAYPDQAADCPYRSVSLYRAVCK
ncbi:MAG: hypothetical protein J6J74_08765 [Elusimicrobiaceae bacterium]|nr:hypothetical protein [Elusimicrobiaceae bacterium]MBP3514551.1 hypothetical protein [Elusimicrobiaceae bacterium]